MAGVLHAPVRMKDQFLRRGPVADGHSPCRYRSVLGTHIATLRPAYHLSVEKVQDNRQVEPSLGGPHVSDVRDPLPALALRGKVPLQFVLRHRISVFRIGGRHELFRMDGPDLVLFHQPCHPWPGHVEPTGPQLLGDPGASVAGLAAPVYPHYLGQEHPVLVVAVRRCTVPANR